MRNDDARWFLHAAQQAQLPDYAMIGYGYGKGVYCLGREKALDAAIEGYVVAHAKHDPKRGAFCTLAFRAMDSCRKNAFRHSRSHRAQMHSGIKQEAGRDDDSGSRVAMIPSRSPSPVDEAQKNDDIRIMLQKLKTLSRQDQSVLRCIYMNGMTTWGYAKNINRSHRLAQMRQNNALKRLREAMGVTT